MEFDEIARLPADTPLADELSNDDGFIEMANLDKSQTGIDGVIWISMMMTDNAPRVKYFARPGRTQPSFSDTIADQPRVVANSLPSRVLNQMSPFNFFKASERSNMLDDPIFDRQTRNVAKIRRVVGHETRCWSRE
jgi:hypothetical protein